MHQVIILSLTDHLAAMGDGLHVIFIFMTGLVQGVLKGEKKSSAYQDVTATITLSHDFSPGYLLSNSNQNPVAHIRD